MIISLIFCAVWCVLLFCSLCPVSCVFNVARVSGLSILGCPHRFSLIYLVIISSNEQQLAIMGKLEAQQMTVICTKYSIIHVKHLERK